MITASQKLLQSICLAASIGLICPPTFGQETPNQSVESSASSADAAEGKGIQIVRAHLKRYVDAFNQRQFDTIGQLLANDVRYSDESMNLQAAGSEQLIALIRKSVEAEPSLQLAAEINDAQPLDNSHVIVRGTNTLQSESEADQTSEFAVTVTRIAADGSDAKWQITSIEEQTLSTESESPIESLGWLVGTWKEESDEGLRSDIAFVPGNQFLRRTFTFGANDEPIGYEMIGYDPRANRVRSWTYFADGSFGSGYWAGEADHWRLEMTQTLADGGEATGTCIVRPIDRDTMTVRIISRTIDGQPLPNGKAVTLKRQTSPDNDMTSDREPTVSSGDNQ
ncbi:nuclear transport factor 2 family protein [Rhodopirellula sp. JC740]|uniref:Nuclear transport factor 2 family protein n=1 Tax=Rhodopirellula halodulae TaxID=2894198 RepID=A0ABS8NJC4_9BACT|nr:nuclear transport factor 2 family protein [Rhodopirellula sp. JC740]MCC9643626.1 nuclear transport factor 2 family protein [Rhodopirellula sp. JC740]